MGKWTKQEMKRTQWPGRWQQMVASCNDAQESKRSVHPSITVSQCTAQLWGRACSLLPLLLLPPGTVPTTFAVGTETVNERRTRETRQRDTGPTSAEITTCGISSLWLPNEQEMDASASCPGTEFTMHPMSLTAMCSTAIKAVREKRIFNQ